MIKNDINNNYNDIFIHMQEWRVIITGMFLKSMPTTELANTDTAYNTINYLSLHLIDRNFFSPIYIVVRAVRNCVLSENWREYKSDKKQKLW